MPRALGTDYHLYHVATVSKVKGAGPRWLLVATSDAEPGRASGWPRIIVWLAREIRTEYKQDKRERLELELRDACVHDISSSSQCSRVNEQTSAWAAVAVMKAKGVSLSFRLPLPVVVSAREHV